MRRNLGQLLTEQGIISEKVLDEALQRQVIFGGRLGTNLLEMGVVTEDDLMRILAFQNNVPYAEARHFDSIPRDVLDSVPKELLARYRIVPIALEGHRVTLAMTDPQKLDIVDEVAFRTNLVVKPVIASEVRIVESLEKYYGIRREARYIAVSEKVADEQRRLSAVDPATVRASEPEPEQELPAEEMELVELTEADIEPEDPFDVTGINDALANIGNRDVVAHVVVRAALRFLDDVFMFIIKGDEAMGWMSGGAARPVVEFGTLTVPTGPDNILHEIGESRMLGRFEGGELFESNDWLKELSLRVPEEVVICPLVLKKHTVAVLVGFNFSSRITDDQAAFMVRVLKKASVAFEILIMKSRIIML